MTAMTKPDVEPCFMTATQAVKLMRSGQMSVEDMAKSCLARIKDRDEDVKAWAYLNPDLILKSARALDRIPVEKRGPLHGVPIAVKDVIYTKDMPTEHNSPIYQNDFPKLDAGPVMTLRASGALIFGKTHTTEFASTGRGYPSKNPYDPDRTPGGSSSGSGAAVGDYQCTLGLGTQTGGSTLRPGSYNGIFAMKPTWTAISREGLKLLSISLDTLGLYGRSAEDLDLMCEVFQLKDSDEPVVSKPISEMKIAVCKTHVWDPKDPAAVEKSLELAWAEGQELLKAAGATLVDLELPEDFAGVRAANTRVLRAEARSAFLGDYLKSPTALHSDLRGHVENIGKISRKQQLADYDYLARLRPIWDDIAAEYDAVLSPTVPGEAWLGLDRTGDARFCVTWTSLHAPSINIPGLAGVNHLPIGLTISAGRYKDRQLCMVAKEIEKVFKKSESGKNMVKLPGVPEGL